MSPGELVRPGPDAGTTDLVFREKGGSDGQAVLIALAAVAWVPILFGGAGCMIFWLMVGFGAGSAEALSVAGLSAAAASLITCPFVAAKELRRVRRVRFAPTQAPARFRFVRARRPGPWLPIADLARILLHETIIETDVGGDPRPAGGMVSVAIVIGDDHVVHVYSGPESPDARQMKQDLDALLSGVGVPVVLETSHVRLPKPPASPSRSGSAHVAAIVTNVNSGGAGPGNAGGSTGGA
ncbi:hypothetical protein ACFZBU_41330 [Embleya sp. NPDC008237]|uniref:hypothetical protein n=1 Tax=Embleya sp. NPDC008237 TaxID=3363978 RepID=UPI0036E856A4